MPAPLAPPTWCQVSDLAQYFPESMQYMKSVETVDKAAPAGIRTAEGGGMPRFVQQF